MRRRRSARLQEEDQTLLREVYQKCQYRLVIHLTDLMGSEAEAHDIAQEAMIRFYTSVRRGRRIHSPMNFLFRTANRLAIRHLKKMRGRESTTFRPPEDITSDLALQEAWSRLKSIWPSLDPTEQLVAKCVLIDQMSLPEIVDSTEISRSSVQRKISGIQKLIDAAETNPGILEKKDGQIGPVIASIGVEEDEGHER